ALRQHLQESHDVEVRLEEAESLRAFDNRAGVLRIDVGQPLTGIRFQLAYQVASLSLGSTITRIADAASLRSSTATELLKVGLTNYAAGAILMPYERFRRSARQL